MEQQTQSGVIVLYQQEDGSINFEAGINDSLDGIEKTRQFLEFFANNTGLLSSMAEAWNQRPDVVTDVEPKIVEPQGPKLVAADGQSLIQQ